MSMILDEMKLAVCERLPELIVCVPFTMEGDSENPAFQHWRHGEQNEIHWPTEGLQVCHEAEELLVKTDIDLWLKYSDNLRRACDIVSGFACSAYRATYEQRLEALCRVWYPERFNN